MKERAYRAFKEFNPNVTVKFTVSDTSAAQGYLPRRSLLEDVSKLKALGWMPQADMSYIYKIDIDRFEKVQKRGQ